MRPLNLLAVSMASLAVACAGVEPPTLMGDDAGTPAGEADAGAHATMVVPPDDPFGGGLFPAAPGSGWASPTQCAPSTDDAHCAECWAQSDGGPRSLGRLQAGDGFGEAVAVADFNGDGYPDLAVGAPAEDVGTFADSGMVFVYLGSVRGFQPWLTLSANDLGPGDAAGRGTGYGLDSGDFDNDGFDDLMVSFQDTSALFVAAYGAATGFATFVTHKLQSFDPSASTELIRVGAASAVADFNDDGYADLAVGAEHYDLSGYTDAGAVFVLDGGATGLATSAIRVDLDGGGIGAYAYDLFGGAVAAHQQAGTDLLVIGMLGYPWVLTYEAGAYDGPYTSTTGLGGFGQSVAVGDLDGDGVREIVVSGTASNWVEVIPGGASIATGDSRGSVSLHAVDIVDLDGDGKEDLLLRSRTSTTTSDALLFYRGNGTTSPVYTSVMTASAREAKDELGADVEIVDIDGDGNLDVCAGAPATGSAGTGRAHAWTSMTAGDWTTGPSTNVYVDQVTSLDACDFCAVFPSPDGAVCDAAESGSHICVLDTCVLRECGDGYRQTGAEPGMSWTRESCDDGNLIDEDACTGCTTSNPVIVSSRAGGDDSPSRFAPSLAEDGNRNILFVYTEDSGDVRRLVAHRTNYGGALLEEATSPIVIATLAGPGWDAEASVAGLPGGGWAVVWTDPDVDGQGSGIALCIVDPLGVPGPVLTANEATVGAQMQPRVATLTGGVGVAWTDAGGTDGPLGRSVVKARPFTLDGEPVAPEMLLSDPAVTASQPAIAGAGDGFLFVWTLDPDTAFGLPVVQGFRLIGETSDTAPFEISELGSAGAEPAVAALGTDFVVAWTRRDSAFDYRGDIQARPIAASGDPLASSLVTTWASTELVGSTTRNVPEEAPSITAFGPSDYLVSYEAGGHRRGLSYGHVGMSVLPPAELAVLEPLLSSGLEGDVTLLSTFRGVWFAWSDANPPAPATSGALRAFLAFLLPGS